MDARWPLAGSPGLWLVPLDGFLVAGTAWNLANLFVGGLIFLLSWRWRRVWGWWIGIDPIFYRAVTGRTYPANCPIANWVGLELDWWLLRRVAGCGDVAV